MQRTAPETHKEGGQTPYELIWDRMPERQNRFSTVWWYYMLFPRQAEGYGPAQMMYGIASKRGRFRINGRTLDGLSRRVPLRGAVEPFTALTLGWRHDGHQLHERALETVTQATLDGDGRLAAWDSGDGSGYGGEIKRLSHRPFGMEARFHGPGGHAHFEAWGDPGQDITSVRETIDVNSAFGGMHSVALDCLQFEGTFGGPGGTRYVEGLGCFHRICINTPWCPWKWLYAVFADGSVFTCFLPYLGLQVLRRKDTLLPGFLERATVSFMPIGLFSPGDTRATIHFDEVRVTPEVTRGRHPRFAVNCRRKNGGFIQFRLVPYDRTQYKMETPMFKERLHTQFAYNVYLSEVEGLSGSLGDRSLTPQTLGRGYGNCEYTWGMAF